MKLIESTYGTYLYDAHGSVTALYGYGSIGNTMRIIKSYSYGAFGEGQSAEGVIRDVSMAEEMGDGMPSGGRSADDPSGLSIAQDDNPYRYCGEYLDFETGYVYLRARYYDPSIGRFISQDSAHEGLNWYVYCGNDPINRVDPSGHFAITALLIAIGVGAALGAAGDVASQMIFQGKSFSEVDWTSVGASAVSGAIGFFTAGICSSSLLGAMAIGAASNAAEYVAYNAVAGNDITWEALGMSAATGAVAAGIGYGIGKGVENFSSPPQKPNASVDDDFLSWLNKGDSDNCVYFGIPQDGNPCYTGITKQPIDKRLGQHNRNGKGFIRLDVIDSGLTRNQARAIEILH